MYLLLVAALLAAPASQPASTAWRAAFLLTRAGDAFANKRFDEAEQLFRSLQKLEPDNETAFVHLAAIANKRGDRNGALLVLLQGVKAQPKSFALLHELGLAYLLSDRAREAVPYLRLAADAQPTSFDARMNLAEALVRTGAFDDAITTYESALALSVDNPVALRQAGFAAFRKGDAQRAIRFLEAAHRQTPAEPAVLLTLGHAYAMLGNDGSALAAYEAAIKAAPRQSTAYVFAGNMHDRAQRKREAEARYREAIRVDARDALARVHLGNLMRRDGRTLAAEREYEAALRIDPKHVWALTQLGFVLFERGETKKAEQLLARALALAPNDNDVEVTLGDLYAMRGKREEAEVRFRRVLARAPTHLGALVKLADSLQQRGKRDEARILYERAVAAHPKSAWALISLGDLLRARGLHADAQTRYEQALAADPLSVWALRQRGYVRFDLKQYEQSIADLKAAAASYPEEAGIAIVLGHNYRALGQYAAAQQSYERAAKMDPASAMAKMFLAVVLTDQGRFGEAITQFKAALKIDPKIFEAWVLLGDAAVRAIMSPRAPASQPSSIAASMLVNQQPASLPAAQVQVARNAYREAIKLRPSAPWPMRQLGFLEYLSGDTQKAAALLASVAPQFPDDVEIALIQGHAAKDKRQLVEAKAHYERAMQIAPNDARTRVFVGATYRDLGDLTRSHRVLVEAAQLDPTSAWVHYERALTLFQQRRLPQAILAAEKATALDPQQRDPWLFLGRLRHVSRQYDAAVHAYAEGARVDPDFGPTQLGYAGALMYRDRPGDLVQAGDRVQRAMQLLPDDAYAHLVTGHVFTRLYERQQAKQLTGVVKLRGADTSLPYDTVAATHLERAVALQPTDQATALSAATSLIVLGRYPQALKALDILLVVGRPLCPAHEWDLTWKIESERVEALLAPRGVEEQRLLPQRDRVAIAYMLAGDIAQKSNDKKTARLRYACSAAIQPERPDAHLQLGYAYESDLFLRLGEQHYVLAQKLSRLTLERSAKKELELDDTRIADLKKNEQVAYEALGRLRRENGFPILPWLGAYAETAYVSDRVGPEVMDRLGQLIIAQNGNPELALTVPRTFYTMAGVTFKPSDSRVLPRFDLQYRFFREEGTFFNDRQTIEPRIGHAITAVAWGAIPLKLAEWEARYWVEERLTYADSPSRQELRSNTFLRGRLTQLKLGSLDVFTGYDFGGFLPRTATISFLIPQDVAAHTGTWGFRLEPRLHQLRMEAALEYRTDQTFLAPSGSRLWGHSLQLDFKAHLAEWFVSQSTRIGYAGTNYTTPDATAFSYVVGARGGRYFGSVAQVAGSVAAAGTGNNPIYETFSFGVDGAYTFVWPRVANRVHSGFNAYAAYELRVAYNVPRFDHLVTVGLSFAR